MTVIRTDLSFLVALLLAPLVAFITVANVACGATTPAEFDKALLPDLQNHCYRCHNAEKREGEFRLDPATWKVNTLPREEQFEGREVLFV